MTNTATFRTYYELAKPRMVYANVLVAAAAFVYASHGSIDWTLFGAATAGLALVIASACVFNNYYDRDIDARMERTKNRAFPGGRVSVQGALTFGAVLLALGSGLLLLMTNDLALSAAFVGFAVYVFAYTPIKHTSPHALFVGAVAGATPPVVGYAAAAGTLDTTALALFLFLFIWQLPHFVAISIYRGEEYSEASVPMYFKGPHTAAQKKIARRVFLASLIVLLAGCALLVAFA